MRKLIYKLFSTLGSAEAKRLEAASRNPRAAQLSRLMSIVSRNQGTRFGREHAFRSIRSVSDYQKAVPVRDYEQISPYIDRLVAGESGVLTAERPLMFARTSGTTGSPKYIPITRAYLEEFRRSSVVSGYHTLANFPGIANGVVLSVASPAEEGRTPGGLPYGAISGFLFLHEPLLIRQHISPIPYDVFLIKDWETRYYTLLRLALVLPLSCIYTLNPSTITMLARKLREYGPGLVADIGDGTIRPPARLAPELLRKLSPLLGRERARALELQALLDHENFLPGRIWPTLKVICCWTKAAAAFYLHEFPRLFESIPICDITYGASEGRGTIFLGPNRELLSVRSHFYEFIPEQEIDSQSPTVLLPDQLTPGEKYYILFTTSGGLYRYHINDVVRVTGFHNQTPLIEFQYKGGNISSFTGEKITEPQVTEAMSGALSELGISARYFAVVPEFFPSPHYRLWIEPDWDTALAHRPAAQNDRALIDLAARFDRRLAELNIEYKSKRESMRLDPVVTEIIAPGSYEQLRQALCQRGIADAQIKLSHLQPRGETLKFFQERLIDRSGEPALKA